MNLDRYRQFLSADDFARLQAEIDRHLPPAIRLNPLRTGYHDALATWQAEYGWQVEPVPFCDLGYQVTAYEVRLSQTLPYKQGDYFIQDAASMLPVELFSAAEAPLVLDMAAAPGGKTTHLVSHFGDRGVLVANDSSPKRVAALRANLQTWGAMGVMVTNFNGELFGGWYPNTFDRVLLDAPCSGHTLRPHKGRKGRRVSSSETDRLQARQIALLRQAIHALRPGGEAVYSTCTLSPDENEAVLDAILKDFPVEVVTATNLPPALAADGDRVFHPQVRNAVRLWPHLYQTSGFFAAKLRKMGATSSGEAPAWPAAPPPLDWLTSADQAALWRGLAELGLDRDEWGGTLRFYQVNDLVYAVPVALVARFGSLPFAALGFLFGVWMGGVVVPSHELVARYWPQFSARRVTLPPEAARIWLEGREVRGLPISLDEAYPFVLLQDEAGHFLGRGKVLAGRLRNLLPSRMI